MQFRTPPPKELFESHLHDTVSEYLNQFVIFLQLDNLYAQIYCKSRGKERSLHSSQKSEKQDKHDKNKNSVSKSDKADKISEGKNKSAFKPLVPSTQNFVNFDKKVIYDFDVFEMEGQTLIATIVDNAYYLHCLNTDSGSIDLIKQEKIELVLSTERVIILYPCFAYIQYVGDEF